MKTKPNTKLSEGNLDLNPKLFQEMNAAALRFKNKPFSIKAAIAFLEKERKAIKKYAKRSPNP